MSYRKITVDGTVHEYTIGKTHTKIKGIGVFKNSDIGSPVYNSDTVIVAPKHIAKIIKGDTSQNPMLMVNQPVLKETGKVTYIPYSKEAFINQAAYLPEGSLTKYVIRFNDPDDYYDHTNHIAIESTLVKEAVIDKINTHNEHVRHVRSLLNEVYATEYPALIRSKQLTKEQREENNNRLKAYESKYKEVEEANPIGIEFVRGKISYELKKFDVLTLEEWFEGNISED